MTTLIFDWSDWDGPATGHVAVTRRTWRRAPESLHVPWQVVVPVDGRATLDVAHVAGEAVSIRWAPRGATSRTDHVLIPDGGEHLAHLLDLVDPSTLEPLPEGMPSAVDLVARAEALVTRIESGEFRGEAGRGVASITAEGETATVRYTDGSVSTLPLPRGPEGAPGRDGADGADGHTPALSWQGTVLAVDGVPGPDLRGPAGEDGEDGAPGPAPSIRIGAVTSGTTPSATIKGTSPDLTLDLVFAKGDQGVKGDTGAPGALANASSYVLVGPGRPDTPSTTGGVITGAEPVGAEYRSTDGANVGAWTWRKRPGGSWSVVDGDTGWRRLDGSTTYPPTSDARGFLARRTSQGVAYQWQTYLNNGVVQGWKVPSGFQPGGVILDAANNIPFAAPTVHENAPSPTGVAMFWQGEMRLRGNGFAKGGTQAFCADPWPSAPLPGAPA